MTACDRCGAVGVLLNSVSGWCQLCMESTLGVLQQRISTALDIPLKLLTGPSPDGLPGHWSMCLPDSGIPNHEQENHPMQRVLRWDVPVDDAWHKIGAGDVVHVASRDHHQSPGDLVEVWTLEETPADSIQFDELRKRAVTVIGTGHIAPDNTRHIGTAVVPTFTAVSRKRDTDEQIVSMAGLVWHVFERYDPEAERQALAEEGRRLASAREDLIAQGHDASVLPVPLHPDPLPAPTTNGELVSRLGDVAGDEATNLAYWLANELGEHVDDQGSETLKETVQRLVAHRLADAHRRCNANGPHIGGFQRGQLVHIDSVNIDDYDDEDAVVVTLDHDHGWRLWVRMGDDPHNHQRPSIYVSPDDLAVRS